MVTATEAIYSVPRIWTPSDSLTTGNKHDRYAKLGSYGEGWQILVTYAKTYGLLVCIMTVALHSHLQSNL